MEVDGLSMKNVVGHYLFLGTDPCESHFNAQEVSVHQCCGNAGVWSIPHALEGTAECPSATLCCEAPSLCQQRAVQPFGGLQGRGWKHVWETKRVSQEEYTQNTQKH